MPRWAKAIGLRPSTTAPMKETKLVDFSTPTWRHAPRIHLQNVRCSLVTGSLYSFTDKVCRQKSQEVAVSLVWHVSILFCIPYSAVGICHQYRPMAATDAVSVYGTAKVPLV